MLTAILFYIAASIVLIAFERRLAHLAESSHVNAWLVEHIYTPLLRTAVLLIFIALAYPALFGLTTAPPLTSLLAAGRIDSLLTAALFLSLLIPLLPVAQRLPGAVLAGQGILACCLLLSWLADASDVSPVHLWMGWSVALQVVAILIAGRVAGRLLIQLYPVTQRERYAPIAAEATRLASEVPAILLYSWVLGQQLIDSATF